MKNIKTILIFFVFTFLVSACDTVRKGFTPDKRSGEEFLVEKKSPLVMPPSYGELPTPSNDKTTKESQTNKIESLISKKKENEKLENFDSDKSFEEVILKKIKNN